MGLPHSFTPSYPHLGVLATISPGRAKPRPCHRKPCARFGHAIGNCSAILRWLEDGAPAFGRWALTTGCAGGYERGRASRIRRTRKRRPLGRLRLPSFVPAGPRSHGGPIVGRRYLMLRVGECPCETGEPSCAGNPGDRYAVGATRRNRAGANDEVTARQDALQRSPSMKTDDISREQTKRIKSGI